MSESGLAESYTKADFTSDQTVRWCPGCGDYSILAQMQKVLPEICEEQGPKREEVVCILSCPSLIDSSYVRKEFYLRHGYPYPRDILGRVNKRDLRLFVISLGAVSGRPFEVLVAAGILSHVCVFWTLARGWFSFGAKS